MQQLSHIIKVERADISVLYPVTIISDEVCTISPNVNFTDLKIKEQASATVESEVENGEVVRTTTLEFKLCHYADTIPRRQVFRLTSADGRQYLLGTHERPYPLVKQVLPFPRGSESQLMTVTVTLKSRFGLLRIL
jgi:hypothetical protein